MTTPTLTPTANLMGGLTTTPSAEKKTLGQIAQQKFQEVMRV